MATNSSGKGKMPAKLSAGGQSKARSESKRAAVRSFDKFVEHENLSARFPVTFDELPEASVINPDTYEDYATYLMEHGPASPNSIMAYVRTLIHISATRFKAIAPRPHPRAPHP